MKLLGKTWLLTVLKFTKIRPLPYFEKCIFWKIKGSPDWFPGIFRVLFYDSSMALIMYDLDNDRISIKFDNSALVQQN